MIEIGRIEKVTPGDTRYGIKVNNAWYSTFDTKLFSKCIMGLEVSIDYAFSQNTDREGNPYRNINSIECVGQTGQSPRVPAQPQQPDLQQPGSFAAGQPETPHHGVIPDPRNQPRNAQTMDSPMVQHVTGKDVSIARMCCLKVSAEIETAIEKTELLDDAKRVVVRAAYFEAWVLEGFCVPAKLDRQRQDYEKKHDGFPGPPEHKLGD